MLTEPTPGDSTAAGEPDRRVLLRPDGPAAPLVKWPGGKRQELKHLMPRWPAKVERYMEPFVGGGAALFATSPDVPAHVNDASDDLVALYRAVKATDTETFEHLDALAAWWARLEELAPTVAVLAKAHGSDRPGADARKWLAEQTRALEVTAPPFDLTALFIEEAFTGIPRKLDRMAKVQAERGQPLPPEDVLANVEGGCRAAAYTTLRTWHNELRRAGEMSPARTATFAVLRELAYAAMFRFNASGDFNVPYGGISYNSRDLVGRVRAWTDDKGLRSRLASTTMHQGDFEPFLDELAPTDEDFIFLDPPYLSDFSAYDGNAFGPEDHRRLARWLRQTDASFQLVIKATEDVRDWYSDPRWSVTEFDKTYAWTIKSRNDREATHLVIENRARQDG